MNELKYLNFIKYITLEITKNEFIQKYKLISKREIKKI